MEIVFNELSLKYTAGTKELASTWMYAFFGTADSLSERLHKPIFIRTTTNLKEILIGNNFSFGEWLHTIQDRDYLRKIIARLTHLTLVERYPYYNLDNHPCDGLGIAERENKISISYPYNAWQHKIRLTREEFNDNGDVVHTQVSVNNVSINEHVYTHYPRYIFEHHNKHDNKRLNLNDGESTLLYDIPLEQDKVQKLLDCSFGENGTFGERLYNYDSSRKLYIEFNKHKDNYFHGYHIEDLNRVPNVVKRKIENFVNM